MPCQARRLVQSPETLFGIARTSAVQCARARSYGLGTLDKRSFWQARNRDICRNGRAQRAHDAALPAIGSRVCRARSL